MLVGVFGYGLSGSTVFVAGLVRMLFETVPSDQVTVHGATPCTTAWMVVVWPLQIGDGPLRETTAFGLGLTRMIALPVTMVVWAVQMGAETAEETTGDHVWLPATC